MPSAGTLTEFRIAQGPGVRVDTYCHPGMRVPPYYDSLIAKLCVWAPDRARAVARMARALDETHIDGVSTTLDLLRDIAGELSFREGRYTTSYLTERADVLPSLRGAATVHV